MSQSPSAVLPSSPGTSHSLILFSTSGCTVPLAVQRLRNSMQRGSDSLKKKCSELFSTGLAPDRAEYGLIRSVGEYTLLHTSQLSPYWSLAWQFGHSPLMNRSGRNICFSG